MNIPFMHVVNSQQQLDKPFYYLTLWKGFSNFFIFLNFTVQISTLKQNSVCVYIHIFMFPLRASLVAQRLKRLPPMLETRVWSLGREDPLEKEMATHSNILAWRIPWTEEPGRLQSTGRKELDTTERLHFHFQLLILSLQDLSTWPKAASLWSPLLN